MPVKNGNGNHKVAPAPEMEKKECCGEKCYSTSSYHHGCCGSFGKKILLTLVGILLTYVIVLLGTMIRNNLQQYYYIGHADKQERTFVVSGQGKVSAKPDIAITSMGLTTEALTVSEAQKKNTETMNKLTERLKALGVGSKDLQTTNYSIYPKYDYTENNGSVLKGYQIDQSVTVKIRNLEKANDVLALAGELGLNNVGGLQFTIDDKEIYKGEARNLALQKVVEKARMLSQTLGVKIVGIVSYNEYSNDNQYPNPVYYGMGGSAEAAKSVAPAPAVEAGSSDVIMNVDVVLEIR